MSCHNIARTIRYNENKIKQGQAECLAAANFLKDPSRLTPEDKERRFERRMELNGRVSTNLHITLNFDPGDKLSNDLMTKIAREYMKEIGFERQPYLVYRHTDAGHPHCHIVTTHVQKNGDPIDLYKIGQHRSEKARLRLESEFGLVTPDMKRQLRQQEKDAGIPRDSPRLIYGEKPLARAMSDVLEKVTENYKYTSLEELNTILRFYNIEADAGKEGTKLHRNRGLRYRALDESGKSIGRPLNASFFDCKPTLANLEKKFALNRSLKEQSTKHLEVAVMWALFDDPTNLKDFIEELFQARVSTLLHLDKNDDCYRVDYVDWENRITCTGSEFGTRYDHTAVQKIIDRQRIRETQQSLHPSEDQSRELRQRRGPRLSLG